MTVDRSGEAATDWAVEAIPSWPDLPHLAAILARAYGAWPGRCRIVGRAWRGTAGSFWLLMLAGAHARRRVRATDHAVVIVDAPARLTRRESGRLLTVFGGLLVVVVTVECVVGALTAVVGAEARWVTWGVPVVLLILFLLELAPVCRRSASSWGPTRQLARDLRTSGRPVGVAGMLAAWPRGRGHARRLLHILIEQADQAGVDLVVAAATIDLAATYRRYGWRPDTARDPLLLVRLARPRVLPR